MALILVAATLIAAGCGSDDDDSAEGGSEGADLQVASTDLGDVLVDSEGMTVYLFVPDAQGESTCYDDCATNWPPVTELGSVGDGLDSELLGTTERTDGSVQATYNGWPLYYFASDAAAGDTNGQGLGDAWYVLDADGVGISGS